MPEDPAHGEAVAKRKREDSDAAEDSKVAEPIAAAKGASATKAPAESSRPTPVTSFIPPGWDASIFGVLPIPDLTRTVCDFLFAQLETFHGNGKLEIEAKLGILVDKSTSRRVFLPVMNECVLQPGDWYAFQPSMSQAQHAHFNAELNKLCVPQPPTVVPVRYAHRRLVDRFYPPAQPSAGIASAAVHGRSSERTRVTTDEKTGAVVECIAKTNLGHCNIYNPAGKWDYRISVNIESERPPPGPEQISRHERRKDRLSYTHKHFRFDLTQVKTIEHGVPKNLALGETGYELEIEFLDADVLAAERRKHIAGQKSKYLGIVTTFLNNIAILNKKSL